jgi:hypothetical protein
VDVGVRGQSGCGAAAPQDFVVGVSGNNQNVNVNPPFPVSFFLGQVKIY